MSLGDEEYKALCMANVGAQQAIQQTFEAMRSAYVNMRHEMDLVVESMSETIARQAARIKELERQVGERGS